MRPGAPQMRLTETNRILLAICALIAVNQLGFGAIVPVIPLYAASFGVPQAAIGMAIAVYGLARFLINVPAGRLADRVGRRGALACGAAVAALGNIFCALAPTYVAFLAARFVAGAGAALVLTASQVVMADISTPQRRGRMMAIYSAVFSFAVGAGPLPGGVLAAQYGLATPFEVFTVLSLMAGLIGWFAVPETRWMRGGLLAGAGRGGPAPLPFTAQLRLLTARRGFMLVSLISFGAFFARTGALFNLIPILGKDRLRLGPEQIGVGLALISIVGLALAYPSGVLVDRFGRKGMIVSSTLFTGVSMLVFAVAPTYVWFLAGCSFWAVASGLSSAAPAAYAADMAPPGMNAAALSMYRTLADSGYVIGPLLLGLIADMAGTRTALVSTALFLTTLAVLFGRFAPETLPRQGVPAAPVPAALAPGDQAVLAPARPSER